MSDSGPEASVEEQAVPGEFRANLREIFGSFQMVKHNARAHAPAR